MLKLRFVRCQLATLSNAGDRLQKVHDAFNSSVLMLDTFRTLTRLSPVSARKWRRKESLLALLDEFGCPVRAYGGPALRLNRTGLSRLSELN